MTEPDLHQAYELRAINKKSSVKFMKSLRKSCAILIKNL